MAFKLLTNIKEEVTCPICLDLLKEPLSLNCGHSFCKACITAANKESKTSQEGKSTKCPVCQFHYCARELRPNWHVANIVEMFREVKVSSEEGQKRNLCERHEEKLLLFCKKDGKVLCWVCDRSQEHRGHQTVPMDEAVQEYQEKIQTALQKAREEQQEAEMLKANLREQRTSWKNHIQNEKRCIQTQFKKLKTILEDEEQKTVQKLDREEKTILDSLDSVEDELAQQSQMVKDLISELEHRLQGSTVDMLQDVHHIMERSKNLTLKKQITFLKEQKKVSGIPDLKVIMQMFKAHMTPNHLQNTTELGEKKCAVWLNSICSHSCLSPEPYGPHLWMTFDDTKDSKSHAQSSRKSNRFLNTHTSAQALSATRK